MPDFNSSKLSFRHCLVKNRSIISPALAYRFSHMPRARRGGRVVECGGLENRCTARYRGFESLPLRQLIFTAGCQLSSRMSLFEN